LIISLINVYLGATTVLMKAFDPGRFLQNVETYRINSFVAMETMLHQMVETEFYPEVNLSSLRWVLSGPAPPTLKEAWAKRGIVIRQVYGLTETTGGAAVLAAEHVSDKPGSTGLPMFYTDIRIVDQDDRDCEPGNVGEILIRGPHVMQAYWNNAAATTEAIRNGWLSTGDLGKLDQEGFLYVVGRLNDMIRSGGENIYPVEVEIVLTEMPQIKEVAIVGIPDPAWGEAVCAVVRLHEGKKLILSEILVHCSERLGKYKIPRRLIVADEPFPRGPAGRVQKQELIEKLLERNEI
jgi:fatty-acyl-CoA synthase